LREIDYISAQSVGEAAALLSDHGDRARIMAGGTDVIVQVREGRRDIDVLIDVKEIAELAAIEYSAAAGLTLGAAAPLYLVYGDAEVAAAYPGLMDAARIIGSVQIQGRASIGGNLCNASPAADAICPLIVHSATCNVQGPSGSRTIAVDDFCTAPGQTALEQGELLVSIQLPAPKANSGGFYLRFIPRNEMDIAEVGAGAYVTLDASGQQIESARVALAAVAPTPLYVPAVGDHLAGKTISDELIQEAAEIAQAAARPISDMRGTAEHRKHLTAVLTRRALNGAIARAREAK
jgi:CO/xanthine dehydrogenase FAD-binding subunit